VAPSLPRLLCPRCGSGLAPQGTGFSCAACGSAYPTTDGILQLLKGVSGAQGYDPHYFASLSKVEESHFWYVSRRELIVETLRRVVPDLAERPLFDLGCGSGGLLAYLEKEGVPIAGGCDAYIQGLHLARARVQAPLVLIDEGALPPLGGGVRLLSLFDVLEHLDDDRSVLRWASSALAPDGVLVLTVPAHPFLFDEMDVLAYHRRRYRAPELREKLESAGFRVRALTHFMAPLVPLLVAVRALGRLLPQPAERRRSLELSVHPLLNPLLLALLRAERPISRRIPLPFGTSLLAVAGVGKGDGI
jgi:SAM-dependent methyltransferase